MSRVQEKLNLESESTQIPRCGIQVTWVCRENPFVDMPPKGWQHLAV